MKNSGGANLDLALLVLRLGAGLLLLGGHGWPKLIHFGARAATFADPLHVGSTVSLVLVLLAEVGCATLVAVGLFTRAALVPVVIFLGVAFFVQHGADPWSKKELAAVYAVPFAALLIAGPGRYSLDARIGKA